MRQARWIFLMYEFRVAGETAKVSPRCTNECHVRQGIQDEYGGNLPGEVRGQKCEVRGQIAEVRTLTPEAFHLCNLTSDLSPRVSPCRSCVAAVCRWQMAMASASAASAGSGTSSSCKSRATICRSEE